MQLQWKIPSSQLERAKQVLSTTKCKLVFLDIDGILHGEFVLNHHTTQSECNLERFRASKGGSLAKKSYLIWGTEGAGHCTTTMHPITENSAQNSTRANFFPKSNTATPPHLTYLPDLAPAYIALFKIVNLAKK